MPSPVGSLRDLEDQRQALDKSRIDFLDALSRLPVAELTSKPSPDRWSLLELAQHLMLAERGILHYLPDRTKLKENRRSLRNRLMEPVVCAVMRAGIRVKVPQQDMVPDGKTTLEQVRRDWQAVHDWLKSFIESMTDDDIRQAYFAHPVSGPITTAQALKFFRAHFDQHIRKIESRIRQLAEK